MTLADDTVRLFFALWPTDAVRGQLASLLREPLRQLPGHHVPVANWHITLAFLGDVPVAQVSCVEAAGAAASAARFALQLDSLGYFRTSRVVWLGAAQCPSALSELVSGLRASIARCNIPLDARPFAAHLTLARKVNRRPALGSVPAFTWPIDSFALVESTLSPKGASYVVRQRWPLRAASADIAG